MKFIYIWFGSYIAMVSSFVLFCLVIDPFALYTVVNLPGINEGKPLVREYERTAKAYAAVTRKFDAVLLGNSRIALGLDPELLTQVAEAENSYNMAFGGAHIYEILHYFRHARATQDLSLVVVGLDLCTFSARTASGTRYDPHLQQLLVDKPTVKYYASHLFKDTLFSMSAFDAAVETVKRQDKRIPRHDYTNGLMPDGGYERNAQRVGHHVMIKHAVANPSVSNVFVENDTLERDLPAMKWFRLLLEEANEHNIEVKVFINPMHAYVNEIIKSRGLWTEFEDWLRILTITVAEIQSQNQNNTIELWDFGGYNSVTTETVPQEGDIETMMNFYWEISHYKKTVGNMILAKMFNFSDESISIPEDFGVLLSVDNIEEHLITVREQRAIYGDYFYQRLAELAQ